MTLEQPSDQRPLPVRLCDIAPEVRFRAAHHVIRQGGDAAPVFAAAAAPSDTTYYVAAAARPLLEAYTR